MRRYETEIIIVSWCLVVLALSVWLLPFANVSGR